METPNKELCLFCFCFLLRVIRMRNVGPTLPQHHGSSLGAATIRKDWFAMMFAYRGAGGKQAGADVAATTTTNGVSSLIAKSEGEEKK